MNTECTYGLEMPSLPVVNSKGRRVGSEGEMIVEQKAQRVPRDLEHDTAVARKVVDQLELDHRLCGGRVRPTG